MALEVDNYDPEPAVKRLLYHARCSLGGPGFRAVRPELEDFMHDAVADALRDAFSKAEGIYLRQAIGFADQASRTLLEGVLAGAEVERRKHEESK